MTASFAETKLLLFRRLNTYCAAQSLLCWPFPLPDQS